MFTYCLFLYFVYYNNTGNDLPYLLPVLRTGITYLVPGISYIPVFGPAFCGRFMPITFLSFNKKTKKQIVKEKTLSLTGIIGIFPAATVGGEDVEVYADESRQAFIASRAKKKRVQNGSLNRFVYVLIL